MRISLWLVSGAQAVSAIVTEATVDKAKYLQNTVIPAKAGIQKGLKNAGFRLSPE
jgi:hypothetical protein